MIQLKNICCHIGDRPLLRDIEWMIHPGRHMALIGPNGAGKTTLLKIIHGNLKPDCGDIRMPADYRIGYLPQEEIETPHGTLLDSVMAGQEELAAIELRIKSIQQQLENHEQPPDALIKKIGYLEHRYQYMGGYDMEHRIKRILTGLGFQATDFRRPVSEFSGGWRMRSCLAGLLLQEPDALLLDEPTNHLDLPALEWLEQYLISFRGSIIIVSHDRFFIDRLATDIYELDSGRLVHFAGNYHQYEIQKKNIKERLEKQYDQQQAYLKKQQQYIDRFRYKATKAAQVQSRIRQLGRFELIELPRERRDWSFVLKVEKQGYKDVLQIRDMSFKYENEWIFKKINLDLFRGDRVAVVGTNGAGKTTLTRLITGDVKPREGTVILGKGVVTGYYSQHQVEALDLNKTVMEEVTSFSAGSTAQKVRDVLGIFQFSGDAVHKRIRVLSGGEKARVALARMLLSGANFMIMDEPTNHLDMISREALERALTGFTGTLLLISHDRYFLSKLVHRVILLAEGGIRIYEGNYTDYLNKRNGERENMPVTRTKENPVGTGKKSKEQKRREAEDRVALNRRRKPYEEKIRHFEREIDDMESHKTELERQLADPDIYRDSREIVKLQQAYAAAVRRLDVLYQEWESAHMAWENLESGM